LPNKLEVEFKKEKEKGEKEEEDKQSFIRFLEEENIKNK